jgi:hypothetical protein
MSQARQRMEPFLKMIHTLLDGTYAMRRAGQQYLPAHPNESEIAYDARLQRTTLLNVLEDAIDNACARLFDEPVRVEGNIPPELVEWCKNIDLQGSNLHEFCDQAMHHALADGQVHILVDYPSASPLVVGGDEDLPVAAPASANFGNGITGNGLGQRAYRGNAFGNGLEARDAYAREGQAYYQEAYDEDGAEPDQTGNGLNARRMTYGAQPQYDDDGNLLPSDGFGPNDQGYDEDGDGYEDEPLGLQMGPGLGLRQRGMTLAEERALGARPYLCLIPHTHLLAMYTARVGGETIVSHVRILEEDVVRDGFAEKPIKRVRILEPGRWEVWTQDETGGGWSVTASGELRKNAEELWDRVPIFTFGCSKRKSTLDVKPPFLDLAYKNIEHFQSSSDQTNILAQARFPMLAVSGFEGDIQTPVGDEDEEGPMGQGPLPFTIGPNTVLTTGDPGGKWYYVEPTGQSIEHGAKDLDRLEREMKAMALEPLMPGHTGSNTTATERGIDEAKARSPLEEWARRMEAKMVAALTSMCDWAGLAAAPEVHFKSKVSMGPQGAQEFANLTQLRLTGNLSKLTLLEEAKRRGILSPAFEPLEEMARLVIEGPMGDVAPYLGLPPTPPDYGMGALPPAE